MCDTITRIKNNTSCAARGVLGKNGLDSNIERRGIERLENSLDHLFAVGIGIDGRFLQENWMFFRGHTKLVIVCVVPDLFHIIPACYDSVFDRVSQ